MSIKFGKRADLASSKFQELVYEVRDAFSSHQALNVENSNYAIAAESLNDSARHSLSSALQDFNTSLETIANKLQITDQVTVAQLEAAAYAGVLGGNWRGVQEAPVKFNSVSTESVVAIPANVSDATPGRVFAMEAYDERENRNASIYSIVYNMQAARQDEFGELFFPTLTITPDNVGFGITVNLMMVYDGIERRITGSFEDFKKRNIIRAVVDPTVLKKDQTRVTPVHRPQSADKFVDPALVAPRTVIIEGESIETAPLAMGVTNDLIALSQTEALLKTGIMDMTDTLDPTVTLQALYIKVGADVLRVNTSNLPYANFTHSTQQNYRQNTLNFSTTSILINRQTRNADGSALVDLAGVVTNDLMVRVEVMVSGTVNQETGECKVFANTISAYSVSDSTGQIMDPTVAPAAPVVQALKAAVIIGYDVLAYRSNLNRRQRGQLIDVTKFTQLYQVPLRSPITTIHPTTTDGQTDASDVQALITATRIRVSNEAVTALINASELLSEYIDARDVIGAGPEILGIGRFYVRPTYFNETVDIVDIVDSLTSTDRPSDIQAALVNKIRDHVFRLYRDSEYKAAADALGGGISQVPEVIIGTDPVIARYLTVSGDLRTLGGEFAVRVVSTLDIRVKNKIYITFGVFDQTRNTTPNPLNFGNMIWGPELVLTAAISRTGQISRETVVQPRYLFVTHLPILGELTILNIPDVLGKVTINVSK